MQDFSRDYPYPQQPYQVLARQQNPDTPDTQKTMQMDMEYFKTLYPSRARRLQVHVEEACDRMEYKDSPMYDQYPDRVMINQVVDAIMDQVQKEMEQHKEEPVVREVEQVEVYQLDLNGTVQSHWGPPPGPPPWGPPPGPPPWGPPPGPPPWGPPPWGPPPGPPPWGPPRDQDWLPETLRLLLINEMQHRRCRNRNCR